MELTNPQPQAGAGAATAAASASKLTEVPGVASASCSPRSIYTSLRSLAFCFVDVLLLFVLEGLAPLLHSSSLSAEAFLVSLVPKASRVSEQAAEKRGQPTHARGTCSSIIQLKHISTSPWNRSSNPISC